MNIYRMTLTLVMLVKIIHYPHHSPNNSKSSLVPASALCKIVLHKRSMQSVTDTKVQLKQMGEVIV